MGESGHIRKYQNNKLWEIWGDEALLLYESQRMENQVMRHNNIELVFLQEFVLRGKVATPIFEFEIRESFLLVGYCASIPEYSNGVSHV